nr:hypothetical protein [Pandoravirus massiliensis]
MLDRSRTKKKGTAVAKGKEKRMDTEVDEQSRCVIRYTVRYTPDPPGYFLCGTAETGLGHIFVTGQSRAAVVDDVRRCAEVLGYVAGTFDMMQWPSFAPRRKRA